ncbi:MAG: hypothetical protein MSH65_05930 [Spirochaetia bacterium]|nr:hypothetical protein [Spirochaetia bacterium]
MGDFLKCIVKFFSSLFSKENKTIISGRNSTNIIGEHNTVNNGQIIEVDGENETLIIKEFEKQ